MSDTRKRTNAEIDLLNQFLKPGETPIPYEVDGSENNNPNPNTPAPVLTDEQKAQIKLEEEQKIKDDEAAAAKQKELDAEAEKEKNKLIEADKNKNIPSSETSAPIEVELNDEKILAYLKNKKGKEVTSLDELLNPKVELTEDQKKEQQEKRDADKIAYGLNKGIFTKKQLEEFITDTNNPQDLVLKNYSAQQKAKDPELTDAEIEEEFNEKFSLNEEVDSRKYQVGQNLLNNLADNLIRQKHSKILNIENDYSEFETSTSTQKANEQKILTQAPLYKRDVEQVRSEIKKVSIPISETESFTTDIDDKVVNEVMDGMLENNYSEPFLKNGWDKDRIKQVATTAAIMKQLPQIMRKYADAEILKQQAGIRGVVPNKERGQRVQEGELTERQKQGLAYIDQMLPQPQVAN